MINDSKRGTGRTTRMLQRAIDIEKDGKAVYIMAATKNHALLLFDCLRRLHKDKIAVQSSFKVGSIKIEIVGVTVGNFDWITMKLRGSHPSCICLVDHFTIESRFSLMLKELTAYDLKEETV